MGSERGQMITVGGERGRVTPTVNVDTTGRIEVASPRA